MSVALLCARVKSPDSHSYDWQGKRCPKNLRNISFDEIKSSEDLHQLLSDQECLTIIQENVTMGWMYSHDSWNTVLNHHAEKLLIDDDIKSKGYWGFLLKNCKDERVLCKVVNAQLDSKVSPEIDRLTQMVSAFSTLGYRYPYCHKTLIRLIECCITNKAQSCCIEAAKHMEWGFTWLHQHKTHLPIKDSGKTVMEGERQVSVFTWDQVYKASQILASIDQTIAQNFKDRLLLRMSTHSRDDVIEMIKQGILDPPNAKICKPNETCKTIQPEFQSEGRGGYAVAMSNFYYMNQNHKQRKCACYCECPQCWFKICSSFES